MTTFNAFVQASRGAHPRQGLNLGSNGLYTRCSNTPSSEEENRAAWRCFKQAIRNLPHCKQICRRYEVQIDRYMLRGDPLLPEYAEKFGVIIPNIHSQYEDSRGVDDDV